MKDSNKLQLYSYQKNKWTHRSPSVDTTFKGNVTGMGFKGRTFSSFSKDPVSDSYWSKPNMYRTSYNDMSKKVGATFYLNFLSRNPSRANLTAFPSMLALFQEPRVIQSLEEATLRSQGDAS